MESILQQMPGLSQPQKKFLITLFSTILLVYGKQGKRISNPIDKGI